MPDPVDFLRNSVASRSPIDRAIYLVAFSVFVVIAAHATSPMPKDIFWSFIGGSMLIVAWLISWGAIPHANHRVLRHICHPSAAIAVAILVGVLPTAVVVAIPGSGSEPIPSHTPRACAERTDVVNVLEFTFTVDKLDPRSTDVLAINAFLSSGAAYLPEDLAYTLEMINLAYVQSNASLPFSDTARISPRDPGHALVRMIVSVDKTAIGCLELELSIS